MDKRVSVSGLCYYQLPLPALIDELQRLGVGTTTLMASALREFGADRARDLLASSGITVAALIGDLPSNLADPQTWESSRSLLTDALDTAAVLGASAVYTVTGPLVGDESESLETYARFIEPVAAHARTVGIDFAIEATLPMYAYVSFTHTLESTLRLARRCNVGICLDLFHVWDDPDLSQVLRESLDQISLVQIGDLAVDSDGKSQKQIPGAGSIPMADLIAQIVDAGYEGVFDLEIDGPFIDAVGRSVAIERAVDFLDETLSAAPHTEALR